MARAVTAAALLALAACATKAPPPSSPPSTTEPALEVASAPETAASEAPAPAAEPEPVASAPSEPKLEPTATGVFPLTDEQRRIFWDTPEDPPAEVRLGATNKLKDKQYLAGNEKTLYVFQPKIDGLGGGYVGVGSDQAYFFVGWARPEFAWLIDYDSDVVAVHAVYRAFLKTARSPDEFMALWEKDTRKDSATHIEIDGDPERTRELRQLYLHHRGWIERRLKAQVKRLRRAQVSSWLSDQETYEFVRDLVLADRVRPMVANLLEPGAMRGVAQAARELDTPVRVLYLSNAEEYWKTYPQAFRDNMLDLPRDDKSILLRTCLIWDVNQDYRYNTQSVDNYHLWLREPWIRNVYDVAHSRGEASAVELNVFESGGLPSKSPRARSLSRGKAIQAAP